MQPIGSSYQKNIPEIDIKTHTGVTELCETNLLGVFNADSNSLVLFPLGNTRSFSDRNVYSNIKKIMNEELLVTITKVKETGSYHILASKKVLEKISENLILTKKNPIILEGKLLNHISITCKNESSEHKLNYISSIEEYSEIQKNLMKSLCNEWEEMFQNDNHPYQKFDNLEAQQSEPKISGPTQTKITYSRAEKPTNPSRRTHLTAKPVPIKQDTSNGCVIS